MAKQIVFLITLIITLSIFTYTVFRIGNYFKFTKSFPVKDWGKRFWLMMKVAIGQTKIFRMPWVGLAHALVFWGFCVILFGSIEMTIDGLAGTERWFSTWWGVVYDVVFALGDVFGLIVFVSVFLFLIRRLFMNIKRFSGVEMKHVSHLDANIALTLILLLMVSLLGMNTFYVAYHEAIGAEVAGTYPVSRIMAGWFSGMTAESLHTWHEVNWWSHILLIFIFANVLPYSKHFHVFMSVPNVFLSRLEPLGYLGNMPDITKEVTLMMDPDKAFDAPAEEDEEVARFGVLDVQDITWKNYLDSLACTECGRCTDVCPANNTGKLLSPRKIMMDTRARMKEKGPGMVKEGEKYDDQKSLIRDYVSEEELWACTLCNACAQECPVNINHPSLIVDMRRYLVMEESKAPAMLNNIFSNIENNGAPWQYSPEDRMLWADDLDFNVPVMADAGDQKPEYLFWVGSAGAYDDRYKKVTMAFARILNKLDISYAVLGIEETDSGDAARRAGNEMLFQMQALMNIEILNAYGVKKIITCDPHDYNTLKNEYGDLGGHYEVEHHSHFLQRMIRDGKLALNANGLSGKRIVFHDPCYMGRANGEYEAPRDVIKATGNDVLEMRRNKSFSFCCGAGGGQMFKEAEKGDKEVYMERTEEALEQNPDIVATACPFCMVMLTDGLKYKDKIDEVKNYDIAEIVALAVE